MLTFYQLAYKNLKVVKGVEVKCAILQTMIFEPELIKHLLVAKMDKHNFNMVYQHKIGTLDYGCFHSKLILYEFDDRLRVIISSSNLYIHDWDDMS